MMARLVLILAIVMMAFTLASCVPGHRGWSCSTDRDCNAGLVCKDFGSSIFDNHYCVSPGTSRISTRDTYGWFKLILVDAGAAVIGLIVVLVALAVVSEWLKGLWGRIRR
jgi:hypothetical protein